MSNPTSQSASSQPTDVRIEKDSMGDRALPNNAYYGIQTLRATENFPISGLKPLPTYVDACLLIKKATAIVNGELRCIEPDMADAIVQAADEVLGGQLRSSLWWMFTRRGLERLTI